MRCAVAQAGRYPDQLSLKNIAANVLLACFTQSRLKAFSHLVPARFFRFGTLFYRRAILFELDRGCLVLTPCGFERGLGL
jgi:hypothetical protein